MLASLNPVSPSLDPASVFRRGRGDDIPKSRKAAHLDKVENSQTFARSAQLRRFLRYLGERTLDSAAPPPSEGEVAGAVFGRDPQFDPRTDSLVRKEMSRLRTKLVEYYGAEGRSDAMVLTAARSYRIEFRWRVEAWPGLMTDDARRCLLVLPPAASPVDQDLASTFYDELMSYLGSGGTYRLVSRTSARWHSDNAKDVREMCGQCGADLLTETALRRESGQTVVLLWLVDGIGGNTVAATRIGLNVSAEELAKVSGKWLNEGGKPGALG